ncbi:hypothetical protein [Rhizobium ruizarguesonis]|uniref:hypothetical protein n=1 Tax=Rhizobium ruizarguesonis TaxID=2081791 RepID=UPI0010309C12|nr:hypothetical protein [Rhizobium ruizarguesonis]TBD71600.1 hypothetical protein ELH11_38535 [Rhizobium ruizarguesonis]TBD94842.1 hypothetical protein ELH09_38255 [Rhizobium ruizarguesonis]TBE14708.1 hypothetical protein ELH08_38940 [Rhizobium ruizarguesonis]WSH04976.1 hypothetical protein U8P71_34700 [Rhizobium ruizarguesonis]
MEALRAHSSEVRLELHLVALPELLLGALGGVGRGIGVSVLGLPHVFFVPAVCPVVAGLGPAAMARIYRFK